jgi:hypothetical protein
VNSDGGDVSCVVVIKYTDFSFRRHVCVHSIFGVNMHVSYVLSSVRAVRLTRLNVLNFNGVVLNRSQNISSRPSRTARRINQPTSYTSTISLTTHLLAYVYCMKLLAYPINRRLKVSVSCTYINFTRQNVVSLIISRLHLKNDCRPKRFTFLARLANRDILTFL